MPKACTLADAEGLRRSRHKLSRRRPEHVSVSVEAIPPILVTHFAMSRCAVLSRRFGIVEGWQEVAAAKLAFTAFQ